MPAKPPLFSSAPILAALPDGTSCLLSSAAISADVICAVDRGASGGGGNDDGGGEADGGGSTHGALNVAVAVFAGMPNSRPLPKLPPKITSVLIGTKLLGQW